MKSWTEVGCIVAGPTTVGWAVGDLTTGGLAMSSTVT
jgi:hypothetical protein